VRRILQLALKDLKRAFRDRSALAITIIAPLGLAAILSFVLGGRGDTQAFEVTFAVVDQDHGPLAAGFIDGPLGGMKQAGFAHVKTLDSVAEARKLAGKGDIAAAFVIPAGFSQAVQSGRTAELEVIADPSSDVGAQIARSAAEQFAAEANATSLAVATVLARSPASGPGAEAVQARAQALAEKARQLPAPLRVINSVAGSKQFSGNTFMAVGMAVFFLFFTAQFGAVSLLTERREGTLSRLLVSPLSRRGIIAGKALYTFALGVVSMTVLVLATSLMLGAKWGDPVAVAALVLAGVFAAMGVQSLVTTLAKTDEQASGYASLVGVTLGLLGGTFFPLSQAGGFISKLSRLTPHFWLMRGFAETSGGNSLPTVAPSLLALGAFGLVTGVIAMARSRALVTVR
jgi:linearmycin/streptolysin S transport system permease protein